MPSLGRFLTRDTWNGDYNRPLSLNPWIYTEGNPVNFQDPSGRVPTIPPPGCGSVEVLKKYPNFDFGINDGDLKGWSCKELTMIVIDLNKFDRVANIGLSQIFGREVIKVSSVRSFL
jgi:hypothetical protein